MDFSCAMFGPDGGLVANAPHIPVHLGAMQEAVQYQVCEDFLICFNWFGGIRIASGPRLCDDDRGVVPNTSMNNDFSEKQTYS